MHEALLFSAQLRLINVSKDKMRQFVEEVPFFLLTDLSKGPWYMCWGTAFSSR